MIVMPSTRILKADPNQPDPEVIAEAAQILRGGGLVAFATETVYGLGADATNPEAVARIFAAKGRPSTNPLIVHVADRVSAQDCVMIWPDQAEILAEQFWPGPLTLVLPRSRHIPDIVTAGQNTVGVRVPRLDVARWLILEAGRPIAAPSANRSLGVSPTLAQHVLADLDGKVDLILDSGPTTVGIESTVLDLSSDLPTVLRPGEITMEQIAEVLGETVVSLGHAAEPAKSPGQMDVHYAPRTRAYRVERDNLPKSPIIGQFAVLAIGGLPEGWNGPGNSFTSHGRLFVTFKPIYASRLLYFWLRELDLLGLDYLIVVAPPDEPRWRAIRDRIWRATRPW